MKKRYKRGILLSTLTTASLLVAGQGFAAFVGPHPDVPLLKFSNGVSGATVAVGQTDAYSPRATCGACHNEAVDDTSDNPARTDGSAQAQGGYHGGGATKTVVKTQGVKNEGSGEVEWVSFNTKAYKHGFVTGRHSQQGRNEDYGHNMRVAFGAKYFESSPGMFGKLCPPSNRQLAAKNIDPLTNPKSYEMGAQSWVENCGVCHAGGGQMEYDRDLNWYSNSSAGGDRYTIKYAGLGNGGSYVTPTEGYMSDSNKAEMDCLMCHLIGSSPGTSWVRTLDCGPGNLVGPAYDPQCLGSATGHNTNGMRTINTTMENGVGEYDMFNRNFALKQYKPGLAASMGAGAKGTFTGTLLTGVDWGSAGAVVLPGARIADTPKSESCAVCHARVDDTMGLPNMMGMRTGYGNFDLLYRPDHKTGIPAGIGGQYNDLDTDRGPAAENDDFFQDFGCKTGMGKRSHKVNAAGDHVGVNGRYGMTPLVPSTLDNNPATTPNPGDVIPGKMPDIDVHNTAGMQCATCHYALGSNDQTKGYVDIPSRTVHSVVYPAERVYGMDHQFAQGDDFPDTKSKNNLDNIVTCESCHITRTHPHANGGVVGGVTVPAAPIPTHSGFPAVHLEKIGCETCHIPETYAAPGRLKYRDWSAGFWHQAQKNVLDWNFDLMTGSHKTVPSMHRWAKKDANMGEDVAKIYPTLPAVLPTWTQEIPNANTVRSGQNLATVCVEAAHHANVITGIDVTGLALNAPCDGTNGVVALYSDTNGAPAYGALMSSPIKSRDAALVAAYVRDNGASVGGGLGDGVCGPAGTCIGGVNAGDGCQDRTDCTKFDIRVNGANTFPLFDGFQLADGLEIDTKAEVDAMLAAFAAGANGSEAPFTTNLSLVSLDFDVTHGIVPVEWALGGSARGGCVSCHSSKDPANVSTYNPNSVGFFEGYVQPMDKAGFMVGGYDLIKNWTAMFADFDCTAMCGMGDPAKNDAYFFDPMTGEIHGTATCGANSPFGPAATINSCVGMMTSTFDTAMGFPSGTAMQMGMYDGIAGLQGFTINTLQTMGTLECNPFGGPISASPIPDMNGNGLPDGNVNSCIPAPGLSPAFDGAMQMMGVMTTADGLATCDIIGTADNKCDNGFRRGGYCATNADCRGAMTNTDEIAHNPMGLILSRKEVRSRQKIDLQQGYPADNSTTGKNNIRWSMSVNENPATDPASPTVTWDQAEYCIDRNPALYPNPFKPGAISCRSIPYTKAECDGPPAKGTWMGPAIGGFCSSPQSPDGQRHIMNMVSANQYLRYSPTRLAELMTPMNGTPRRAIHVQHVTSLGMHCSDCHYLAPNTNTNNPLLLKANFGVQTDTSKAANLQFVYTPRVDSTKTPPVANGTGTCATACHNVAAAALPSDVATARISAKHATDTNFKVHLDGSKSACYHVDPVTGVTTPGTKTYAWTIAGTLAGAPAVNTCSSTPSANAECDATWAAGGTNNVTLAVTCTSGGTSNSSIVGVTGFEVQAIAQQNLSFTVTPAGADVTVAFDATPTHRATTSSDGITTSYTEVLDGVVISWANRIGDISDTKLVAPFGNPANISQVNTYADGTHSIAVRTTITTTKTVHDVNLYPRVGGGTETHPDIVTIATNRYDYNAGTDAVLGGIVTLAPVVPVSP